MTKPTTKCSLCGNTDWQMGTIDYAPSLNKPEYQKAICGDCIEKLANGFRTFVIDDEAHDR